MTAETQLTYNGITLRNVLTKRFDQVAEYDPTGADIIGFKFAISVVGYCHVDSNAVFGVSAPATHTSGANVMAAVRSKLLEPRADLLYKVGVDTLGNGSVLLEVNGPADRVFNRRDIKNGPKPRRCTVTQVVNSSVLEVEYEIHTWVIECRDGTVESLTSNDTPDKQNAVLSNRWSCMDTIDQNMRTTRTISGLLMTASGTINPNSLRDYVVPRLQMGFRRDSMSFKVTPDALSLEYTIVDKEVTHSPPPPATSWRYTAKEQASDKKLGTSSIDITLAGPRDVDKGALIRIAVAIVKARLYNGDFTRTNTILLDLAITDSYGDDINAINLSATVQRNMQVKELLGVQAKHLGKPISAADLAAASPTYNRDRSRGNYPADPIELEGPIPLTSAWQAYLQNPCDDDHRIENADTGTGNGTFASNRVDYNITASITTDVGDPTSGTSSEHNDAIYTHYELESKYQTSENNVALPIAGQRYTQTDTTETSKVVGLALNTTTRTIRISAQRVGKQPKLPKPEKTYTFGSGKAHLLRNVVTPKVPDRTADGKELHTVLAEFTYAITVPPPPSSQVPIGVNPWEDPAFATHVTDTVLLSGDKP